MKILYFLIGLLWGLNEMYKQSALNSAWNRNLLLLRSSCWVSWPLTHMPELWKTWITLGRYESQSISNPYHDYRMAGVSESKQNEEGNCWNWLNENNRWRRQNFQQMERVMVLFQRGREKYYQYSFVQSFPWRVKAVFNLEEDQRNVLYSSAVLHQARRGFRRSNIRIIQRLKA